MITPENVIELMKTTNEFGLFYVGRAPVDVEQRVGMRPSHARGPTWCGDSASEGAKGRRKPG
ncbi:hypothetical protein EMIT0158MI4_270034 [Burkholderia ambifaria]